MINSLQGLRGLFFLFIFFHHIPIHGGSLLEQGGPMGVSFFIVLSGFVMCLSYQDRIQLPTFHFKDYFIKKVLKVYPLHLLCFGLFLLLNPHAIIDSRNITLVPNLLLLQSWIPKQPYYFSGNALSWYLSDALFFYAIFPFVVDVIKSKRFKFVLGGLLIVYLLSIFLIPEKFVHPILYINPLFRFVEFVLGCVLCCLYMKHKDHLMKWNGNYVTILQVIAILLTALFFYFYPILEKRFAYVGIWIIPMLFLVFSFSLNGFFSKLASNRIFMFLGTYSLYFYMLHLLMIQAYIRLFNKFSTVDDNIAYLVIVSFLTTLVVGILVAKYVDKPIVKRLTNFFYETNRI